MCVVCVCVCVGGGGGGGGGTQDARAHLYGAEKVGEGANGPLDSVHSHSVPCAVCYTLTRRIVVMIPAQYILAHSPGPESIMDILWETATSYHV